jgi:hypothetical protein
MLSSTIPDRYVRPSIAFVIFASGLKYVGLQTTALGWTLCALLLAAAVAWLVFVRPWEARVASVDGPVAPVDSLVAPVDAQVVPIDGRVAPVDGRRVAGKRKS